MWAAMQSIALAFCSVGTGAAGNSFPNDLWWQTPRRLLVRCLQGRNVAWVQNQQVEEITAVLGACSGQHSPGLQRTAALMIRTRVCTCQVTCPDIKPISPPTVPKVTLKLTCVCISLPISVQLIRVCSLLKCSCQLPSDASQHFQAKCLYLVSVTNNLLLYVKNIRIIWLKVTWL